MKTTAQKRIIRQAKPSAPVLRFSPTAWAKLLFLRDAGETEIGGFGISARNDLLFIEAFELVSQTCTWVHVAFDDSAVAEFFDDQVDAGRKPEQFARIWIHTHPGKSAEPSGTDEATFTRVFGRSEWAVMFILARGGQTYVRLRYNVGPGAELMLPVEVDYSRSFAASNVEIWKAEYDANVRVPPLELPVTTGLKPPKAPVIEDDVLDPWWGESWSNDGRYEDHQLEGEYDYIRDF